MALIRLRAVPLGLLHTASRRSRFLKRPAFRPKCRVDRFGNLHRGFTPAALRWAGLALAGARRGRDTLSPFH